MKSFRTVILTCDSQTNLTHKYVIGVVGKKKEKARKFIPHELPTKISNLIKH